ncbi:oligopeptide transport system permease protein [Gracilibacillus ureilyticus]|uniref:Oligopeptide transport system permease protein n=1 Tax=Gracilibacillus ureilyticus TaxID=531814 RepID=A0A1H9SPU0_9BACI|nr:oligopeptide ABC transporter permease [Gracilibacillus ureilyticus]SER86795.1 oligopeptide transport system permease protein [Gracilibacillus ureilyticus]
MAKYLIQRLIYMIITLFIIITATFFLMKIMPGSPFNNLGGKITEEQQALLEEKYGLDDPVPVQYFKYLTGIVRGDFGVSFQYENRPVTDMLLERIGPSAELGAQALIIGAVLGIILGMIAAIKHNTWIDYTSNIVAVIGISIPSFVFAGLLQYYLAVKWRLFPVSFWESPIHTVLPTIALMIFPMAICARFMRTEMLEVLGSDYIELARAKGVSNGSIMFKHALRNALIPVITVLGPMTVSLMTGTLVIEQIFAVPGIGEQFVSSINTNDYPVIMGTTILFAVLFVVVILIVDLLYGLIDPRIRITGGGKD